jgi:hypothetical protein
MTPGPTARMPFPCGTRRFGTLCHRPRTRTWPCGIIFTGRCSVSATWYQARVRREEAPAEARRLSPFNVAYAVYHARISYWAIGGVGSIPTMLRSADEILAISNEHGFALWSAFGKMIRGWCLGARAQAAEGIPLLIQGLADSRAIGCGAMLPFYLTTLGRFMGWRGSRMKGSNGSPRPPR